MWSQNQSAESDTAPSTLKKRKHNQTTNLQISTIAAKVLFHFWLQVIRNSLNIGKLRLRFSLSADSYKIKISSSSYLSREKVEKNKTELKLIKVKGRKIRCKTECKGKLLPYITISWRIYSTNIGSHWSMSDPGFSFGWCRRWSS